MSKQLSQEDYENIWLRVKEKGKFWVIGWVSFIVLLVSLAVSFGIENYMEKQANDYINQLVSSEDFKNSVLDSLDSKVKRMNENYQRINQRLEDFELLKNIPYEISSNGLEFTDENGDRLVIEFGNSKINQKVQFESTFSKPPIVIATNQDSTAFFPSKYKAFQPDLIAIKEVTKSYFIATNKEFPRKIAINWIAIGN